MATYLGLDQIDWGGNKCYEFWKLAPCCGAPDVMGALKCIVHWWCCGLCSMTHLHGSSVGSGCNIVPSCLWVYFCGPCAAVTTRYNIRTKKGYSGHIIGDLVCVWFCGPFAWCQTLRAASVGDWALWPIPSIQVMAPIKLMN